MAGYAASRTPTPCSGGSSTLPRLHHARRLPFGAPCQRAGRNSIYLQACPTVLPQTRPTSASGSLSVTSPIVRRLATTPPSPVQV